MNVPAVSNEQARQALAQILRSPRFRRFDPGSRLGDLLRRLWERLGWHPMPAGAVHLWLGIALILIVLAGIAVIVYLARLSSPIRRLLTPDAPAEKAAAADRPSPASLLAAAELAAAGGNFRSGLRDLYLSLLLELDGRGLLSFRAAKTNREYLAEIGGTGLEQPFRSLVNLFEFKWYGLENCSAADFRTGRDLYAVLLGSGGRG